MAAPAVVTSTSAAPRVIRRNRRKAARNRDHEVRLVEHGNGVVARRVLPPPAASSGTPTPISSRQTASVSESAPRVATATDRTQGQSGSTPMAATRTLTPTTMPRIATVDDRFQSYNVEMVEVTGGRFWKPYSTAADREPTAAPEIAGDTPAGMDPTLYAYRPPIDLARIPLATRRVGRPPAEPHLLSWSNDEIIDIHRSQASPAVRYPRARRGVYGASAFRTSVM